MSFKAPSIKSQQTLIDRLNNTYKVGDKIKVRLDDDSIVEWTVRNPATLLGGNTAVIWAEEHPSCYLASRVQK